MKKATRSDLAAWPREHFAPGGGDAHLFFKVHGRWSGVPAISPSRHRCAGVPEGCELQQFTRASQPGVLDFGLRDDTLGRMVRPESAAFVRKLAGADECLVLRGVVPDPEDLGYFRDAVGLVMALLEAGGVGVFDPHMFKWWSKTEWRKRVFEPAGAVPRHHVVILVSDEEDGRGRWFHTRGLLKFGRPDLSVHHVSPGLEAGVLDLLNRLIEMQAFGHVIEEGQAIRMRSLPEGWTCRHGGNLDDPDFNNRHVEIGPPAARKRRTRRARRGSGQFQAAQARCR